MCVLYHKTTTTRLRRQLRFSICSSETKSTLSHSYARQPTVDSWTDVPDGVDPFRQDCPDNCQRRILYVVFKGPESLSFGIIIGIISLLSTVADSQLWLKPQLTISKPNSQSLESNSELCVVSIPFSLSIVAVRLQSRAAEEASSQEISCCFKPSAIHEPHFWNEPTKPSQQHSVNETPTIDIPPGTRLFRRYCACCATKQRPQRKKDAIRSCQILARLLILSFIHLFF